MRRACECTHALCPWRRTSSQDRPAHTLWAKTRIPRLGLPIIAAQLAAQGHEVCIYSPQLAPIDWDDVSCSELVGLSTTTSTALAAYEMADQLRAQGVPVVAGDTAGMVGADLANLVNEAALSAARHGEQDVGSTDFSEALERIILGTERRIVLSPLEKERTAYHDETDLHGGSLP